MKINKLMVHHMKLKRGKIESQGRNSEDKGRNQGIGIYRG